MEKEDKARQEAQQERNRQLARMDNVNRAQGFIHIRKGKRYFRDGVPQRRRGKDN